MAQLYSADVALQIPQIWSTRLYSQAENQTYFHMMEGPEGSNMPIIRKDDLSKGAGDTIHTDMVLALTGAGQLGDTTSLEGNEEAMKFRQSNFTVSQLSHAVRWTELTEILINHNMRTTGQNQLAKWLAGRLDDLVFSELSGAATVAGFTPTTLTTSGQWFAGTATTRNTVADGNTTGRLTLATITELKAYAQTELKIQPIKVDGDANEYFVLVVHPYTAMQLKEFDTSWSQAQRDAQTRGDDNPLFTGAVGIWDGVIIKVSNRVPRYLNTGPIQVSDNIFMGAQALSRGYAFYPDWREQEFDYGRSVGIATVTVVGQKRNVFDLTGAGGAGASSLTSIGSITVFASAVAPAQ